MGTARSQPKWNWLLANMIWARVLIEKCSRLPEIVGVIQHDLKLTELWVSELEVSQMIIFGSFLNGSNDGIFPNLMCYNDDVNTFHLMFFQFGSGSPCGCFNTISMKSDQRPYFTLLLLAHVLRSSKITLRPNKHYEWWGVSFKTKTLRSTLFIAADGQTMARLRPRS